MIAGYGVLLPHTRSRAMHVPDGPTMMQAQPRGRTPRKLLQRHDQAEAGTRPEALALCSEVVTDAYRHERVAEGPQRATGRRATTEASVH